MADEAASSEIVDTSAKQEQARSSVEETIDSNNQGGVDSSCNDDDKDEDRNDDEKEKLLDYADELMERGIKAKKDNDYVEATDLLSRALEIKVAHYGELAPQCVDAYYQYGSALLWKAQDEADPLGSVPKEGGESQQDSHKDGSAKGTGNGDSSVASVSSTPKEDESSNRQEKVNDEVSVQNQEEDGEESDAEDLADADEEESDLDLAWKMLDIARAIAEKQPDDTMEKVDILSALAEVSLEREDFETSRSDYLSALVILERLVEPDSRRVAELNFRICLCLEVGSKPQEAIPYCQRARSILMSRIQRLKNEGKNSLEMAATSTTSEPDQTVQSSSNVTQSIDSVAGKKAEIEALNELYIEMEKKLEDLQQLVSYPASIPLDILGMVTANAKNIEKSAASVAMGSSQMGAACSAGIESPTVSTAHTNGNAGVTHLGVVGRGVKRVVMNSATSESGPNKKPALEPSAKQDDNAS